MKIIRCGKVILAVLLALTCISFIPEILDAQVTKTSISEILKNPDKYDGKMVQIEGKVGSIRTKTSQKGNLYTTVMIIDSANAVLNVFSLGMLSLKKNDSVTVIGRYQKVKHVGSYSFYNEIDASEGNVERAK